MNHAVNELAVGKWCQRLPLAFMLEENILSTWCNEEDVMRHMWHFDNLRLLLAAVHCPWLTHARTMSVFPVLFCQSMSIPGVEYSRLSHSSFSRTLSPETISSATPCLLLGFFVRLSFSDTSIPSHTTQLELRRFHTTSL